MTDYIDPDHWVKAFAEVIKERDEARAEVERVNKQLEQAIAERTPHDYGILKEEAQEIRKQRDEAHAEVEQLKQALHDARLENSGQAARIEELKKGNEIITAAVCSGNSIEVERAIQERDAAIVEAKRTRPEPSRLEIAAMLKAGWFANRDADFNAGDYGWWIEQADMLIAAAREGK